VKGAPTRELNAGLRVECFQPVKPGDVITARSKMIDAYEKRGKTGKYVYTVDETVCTNQRGEIVMKFGHTFARH
jgi:acyl dehydratase